MKTLSFFSSIALAGSFTLLPGMLQAAGFQIVERSASGLGRAFSGEAAIGDDASILSSNPAGGVLLDNYAFSAGGQWINPNIDASGRNVLGVLASDDNLAPDAWVPYFYYSQKIDANWGIGISLFSPFGLVTDYSDSFASLASTQKSEVKTLIFNPSLYYRINNQWTVGLGVSAAYAEGEISSLNTLASIGSGIPGSVGSHLFHLEGDDWAMSWNLGVLYELNEKTRIGFQYRGAYSLHLKGTATGSVVGLTGVSSRPVSLDITLPDIAEISIFHRIDDKWSIHGDITWTNWSEFQQLAPSVHPAINAAITVQENWKDSFRYAVGASYQVSDKLTLRAGLALDKSPVRSSSRTLRIPDGPRVWTSLGASIDLNEHYTLDVGYTHLFAESTYVNLSSAGGNEGQFSGKVSGGVDIIGIGVHGSF